MNEWTFPRLIDDQIACGSFPDDISGTGRAEWRDATTGSSSGLPLVCTSELRGDTAIEWMAEMDTWQQQQQQQQRMHVYK